MDSVIKMEDLLGIMAVVAVSDTCGKHKANKVK